MRHSDQVNKKMDQIWQPHTKINYSSPPKLRLRTIQTYVHCTVRKSPCSTYVLWNLESFYKTRSFYAIFCIVVFLGGENRGKVNRWNFLILENEQNNLRFFYFSFPVEVWPANGIYKLVSQTPSQTHSFWQNPKFLQLQRIPISIQNGCFVQWI